MTISCSTKDLLTKGQYNPDHFIVDEENKVILLSKATKISIYSLNTRVSLREVYSDEPILCLWKLNNDDAEGDYAYVTRNALYRLSKSNTAAVKSEKPIGEPHFRQCISVVSSSNKTENFLLGVDDEAGKLWKWNFKTGKMRKVASSAVSRFSDRFLYSGNASVIAAVLLGKDGEKQDKLCFFSSSPPFSILWTWKINLNVTIVACHDTDILIATGDLSGKITIWRPGSSENDFIRSIHHWHPNPVSALTWDEEFLYSGGEEEVLILWHPNDRAGPISTVPRLGGRIRNVVISNEYVTVDTENNSIQFFTRSNLIKTFDLNGPTFDSSLCRWFSPLNCIVFVSSGNRTLQFIDPKSQTERLRLEIVQENKITGERKKINNTKQKLLSFDVSEDGRWIVTMVEEEHIVTVNTWKFESHGIRFEPQTTWAEHKDDGDRVEVTWFQGHSGKRSRYQVILSGLRGRNVKIWNNDNHDDDDNTFYWFDTISYRNLNPGSVSSSEDGSVIAIAFERYVTLWRNDQDRIYLITTLSSTATDVINSIVFGKGFNSNLLFSATPDQVFLWDILRMKLIRKIKRKTAKLYTLPDKRFVASADENGILLIDRRREFLGYEGRLKAAVFSGSSSSYIIKDDDVLCQIRWSKDDSKDDNDEQGQQRKFDKKSNFLPSSSSIANFKQNVVHRKDPSLWFENVQNPLSAFSTEFIERGLMIYKNTFFHDK